MKFFHGKEGDHLSMILYLPSPSEGAASTWTVFFRPSVIRQAQGGASLPNYVVSELTDELTVSWAYVFSDKHIN